MKDLGKGLIRRVGIIYKYNARDVISKFTKSNVDLNLY